MIGILTIAMSRVLLNVPAEVATAVALMTAVNILIVCAFIAMRPKLNFMQGGFMAVVAVVPLVIGGMVAAGALEVTGGEEHGGGEESPMVEISAENVAFSTKELKVPAGKAFQMKFENKEAVPHNVAILKAQGSTEVLFRKDFFPGPKTITWDVEPIEPGTYFFQCDVHPNMSGSVLAEERPEHGKEGNGELVAG